MSLNEISGSIVLKETGVGIAGLLIVIHDLDPGTRGEDAADPTTTDRAGPGDRIGSRVSDADGKFAFAFDDAEIAIRNAKERRPDLQLSVLAPEEPGLDAADRILFVSKDVRIDAGRMEEYLIRLPRELLVKAGIIAPAEQDFTRAHAASLSGRFDEMIAWRSDIRDRTRQLTADRVGAAREAAVHIEEVVREKLIDSITGMTADEALAARIVRPGQNAAALVWATVKARIRKANEAPATIGYLSLTDAQAGPFRAGSSWRTDIAEDEIEPLLFAAKDPAARPTTLTRTDPLAAMCRSTTATSPVLAPVGAGGGVDGAATAGHDSAPPPDPAADYAASIDDLPRFVGRMIADITSPDHLALDGMTRPTAAQVQAGIQDLKIGSGPSDVTAFHDYQNLQIAFDYVWKQIIDDDAVATATALAHGIADAGGDAVTAIAAGTDPIAALKRETRVVARVNDDLFGSHLPDWMMDPGFDVGPTGPFGPGGSGGGGGGPVVTGPYTGGVTGGVVGGVVSGGRQPHELLDDLEEILAENYKFEVFAPGSTNFGLMVTYRQKWEPVTYQAGDLVHTMTLAPKETRKVFTRRTIKRERSERETEANLKNRNDELKSTMRADAEVVDRASTKTNFNLNAKGTYNVGFAKGDSSTTIDRTADAASQETKKSFHEDVMSAAMQLRSEKNWAFETKETDERESTDTAEISNPNDELTVTYLFYELERRYLVSEHLHKLTPVVLVAMDVPNPNRKAIDKVLLKHSWIINRVLLDDRYRAPLDYLTSRIVGDELGLAELLRNLNEIRAAVEQMKKMQRDMTAELLARENALDAAIKLRATRQGNADSDGVFTNAVEWAFGDDSDDEQVDAARILEDMRREDMERAARHEKEVRMRLDAETATLDGAAQAYAKAYAEHSNQLLEVAGLRAHFKENVLYYMQAIWSFTFDDQIFFSLYKIKAPRITKVTKRYSITPVANPGIAMARGPGRIPLMVSATYVLKDDISVEQDAVTLAEIADLDKPLGFKGNYMIFPLRQSNPLVDLMMLPYVDTELGLHDPDELGAWSPEDFAAYARCLLKKHRDADDLTPAELRELEDRLVAQHAAILSSPRRVSDEIIVPTDSLFIEALPGTHALLEDFKLRHRMMDLERAREETRKLKLESLRYAARVLDKEYGDPDVDRQIVINGSAAGLVLPADQ